MKTTPRPRLTVNLSALQANYQTLCARRPGAETGAVVKANAYGFGAERVVPALIEAGCRTFFTAYTFEAVRLRQSVEAIPDAVNLCVFNGPSAGDLADYDDYNLTPVLNTLAQVSLWQGQKSTCMLQVDTGMNRLGLTSKEVATLATNADAHGGLKVSHILSHFACSSDPGAAKNKRQVEEFKNLTNKLGKLFPKAEKSISASGGIFLPFDIDEKLTRPGVALYGASPQDQPVDALQTVATLEAPVMQIREVSSGESVGYGATFTGREHARVATLGIGYADGYPRHLSNCGKVILGGRKCPVIGAISMDLITVDITDCEDPIAVGAIAECFGPTLPVAEIATLAGTIAYEIFVTLGDRVERRYVT